jgi:hypothetical protein
MVLQAGNDNRLLASALVASLLAHVLIALLLPTWSSQALEEAGPVVSVSLAHVMRIVIQRPAAQALPAALPQTRNHAAKISFARKRSELSVKRRSPHTMPTTQNAPIGPLAAAPTPMLAHRQAPLYARPATSSMPIATHQNSDAPTPQPETTVAPQAVAGNATADRGGVMPLGAQQDPVLDPGVRAQLQRQLTTHVTLVVTVGEDGRTKSIVFEPPLDGETERTIQAILADANWDAAICGGGVSCEGTATLKF